MRPEQLNYFVFQRLIPWLRRYVFRPLNWFFPKEKRLWVFHSKPVGYRDNARALYDYIIEHVPNIEPVWLVDAPEELVVLRRRGVPAFHWRSLRGLWRLFRASTILTTHFGFNDVKVRRQRSINLGHGMPLKTLGFTQTTKMHKHSQRYYDLGAKSFDGHISTSPIMRLAIANSFGTRLGNVAITGQPRTDRLFQHADSLIERLRTHLDIRPTERIIFWTPTYRKPRTGFRDEGLDLSTLLLDKSCIELNHLLSSTQARLLIKTHQFEEWESTIVHGHDRIHLLSDAQLGELDLELHDILPGADVLITDYSSIFIDYLLLDRPLVFFAPDLDTYRARRGFVLEPFHFWTPGPKVHSLEELRQELARILAGEDSYRQRRAELKPVFHTYSDDRSCERVIAWLTERSSPHR